MIQSSEAIEEFLHQHQANQSEIKKSLCQLNASYGEGRMYFDTGVNVATGLASLALPGGMLLASTRGVMSANTARVMLTLGMGGVATTNFVNNFESQCPHYALPQIVSSTQCRENTDDVKSFAKQFETSNCALNLGLKALDLPLPELKTLPLIGATVHWSKTAASELKAIAVNIAKGPHAGKTLRAEFRTDVMLVGSAPIKELSLLNQNNGKMMGNVFFRKTGNNRIEIENTEVLPEFRESGVSTLLYEEMLANHPETQFIEFTIEHSNLEAYQIAAKKGKLPWQAIQETPIFLSLKKFGFTHVESVNVQKDKATGERTRRFVLRRDP